MFAGAASMRATESDSVFGSFPDSSSPFGRPGSGKGDEGNLAGMLSRMVRFLRFEGKNNCALECAVHVSGVYQSHAYILQWCSPHRIWVCSLAVICWSADT